MTEKGYTLYGSDFSLYTGKVRSYLRKKGIPFEEVLSTLTVYKNFIIPRTGVRYIPVVQTPDDQVLQDTTVIIDELEKRFPEKSVYPTTPRQKLLALLLETYADEWLVIPAMHYRWAYQEINQPFIFQKFGNIIAPWAPAFLRAWLGKKIGSKFKGFVPLLGIKEHNTQVIERSYEQLLGDLDTHFSQHDYLLGNRPCIADFGFIGPFFAHLYHDPYPSQQMRARAPAVVKWVERMVDQVPANGEFLADDEIPASLLPVLQRMAVEQLPVLLDTDKRLAAWRSANPGKPIPRSIGDHEFTLAGVSAQRMIIPYSLWMFARPVNYYQSLSATQRTSVDGMLVAAGFDKTLQSPLINKLGRIDNHLTFA